MAAFTRSLLALCMLLGGALSASGQEVGNSLAGQLLVASRAMGDPNFEETVIYMVEHDDSRSRPGQVVETGREDRIAVRQHTLWGIGLRHRPDIGCEANPVRSDDLDDRCYLRPILPPLLHPEPAHPS